MNFVELTDASTGKRSLHNADMFERLDESDNRAWFKDYIVVVAESYDEAADRIMHAFGPDDSSPVAQEEPERPLTETDLVRMKQQAFNHSGQAPQTMPSEGAS
jgi:hypothetical protein